MRVFPTWCGEPIVTRETAPAAEPVTLAELKAHLRIEHTDDDAVTLPAILEAARGHLDGWHGALRRPLINQGWRVAVREADRFARLFAPLAPCVAVVSIQYYAPDADDLTTADASHFRLIKTSPDWAYLEPKAGRSWPSLDDRPDALQAVFTCGYGADGSKVPPEIRHAIKLIAGHLYENREQSTALSLKSLPFGVEALICGHRNGVYG